MKNPNGYGSVIKRKARLRAPYLARVTVGWKEVARPDGSIKVIQEFHNIGSYKTRAEALQALAEYNKNPKLIKGHTVTYGELYPLWVERQSSRIKKQTMQNYEYAYRNHHSLFENLKIIETRIAEIEQMFKEADLTHTTAKTVLMIMRGIYDLALHQELIAGDNPLEKVELPHKEVRTRKPHTKFTDDQVQTLWENIENVEGVDVVLFLIYTGLRGAELENLRISDIHFDSSYFDVTESKTKSGIRKVPIADKIKPICAAWLQENKKHTFLLGAKHTIHKIHTAIETATETLNMPHLAHDTRYTFVSLLANKGVDERYIQVMVGHSTKNITRNVYQELDLQVLIDAVNKI